MKNMSELWQIVCKKYNFNISASVGSFVWKAQRNCLATSSAAQPKGWNKLSRNEAPKYFSDFWARSSQ
jgi:hypothetical protein